MSHYSLKDKYALVTGASSGIGKEIARCLAEEGTHCVLSALPSEASALESVASELKFRKKINTWALAIDLATDNGPRELYEKMKQCIPRLDILINNAGILTYGVFHEIPLIQHEKLLRVNVRAYMLLMHYALGDMMRQGQGRILNVSSMAAFQSTSYHSPYGASKAFVQSLSEGVNLELKGKNINIITLNPGLTDTPLLSAYPRKIWFLKICKLYTPAQVAKAGVSTLKDGKDICIPGWDNWFLAHIVPRLLPRSWVNRIAYLMLKQNSAK
ncbi:MAG: SDR family NAD(P)-dependent oxidoreductase [Syntrophales bacterium]|jgi:short-subunit dehydrogenase